jgi:acid stress-induced BolA-like protein IbaG/YrbA
MALRILSAPGTSEALLNDLRSSIENAIEGAKVDVSGTGAGHFEICVMSKVFAGKSRLKQQQLVYSAIAHLMKGDTAPVHAIDRLQTLVP